MEHLNRHLRGVILTHAILLLDLTKGYTNNVAFIIPLHRPKFEHMAAFLDSYQAVKGGVNADIATVFSTHDEKVEFETIHYQNIPEKGYLPLVYNGSTARLSMHPVFYKKFWAIWTLLEAYNFFFLVDSEVKIVKSFDAEEIASTIYYRKIFYGSEAKGMYVGFRHHNEASMLNFRDADKQRLRVINKNNTIYFWYNEIPVVEAKSARRFLEYISFSQEISEIREPPRTDENGFPRAFDYISYAFYCILYEDFALLDVGYLASNVGSSFGEMGGGESDLLLVTKPHWATERAWLESREKFDRTNIVLLFHCDR